MQVFRENYFHQISPKAAIQLPLVRFNYARAYSNERAQVREKS